MGTPVDLGRVCGLCGEQVTLSVKTDGGTYTDDLTALLDASHRDKVIVQAECNCPRPQETTFQCRPVSYDEVERT
jgi:hypothetical protein